MALHKTVTMAFFLFDFCKLIPFYFILYFTAFSVMLERSTVLKGILYKLVGAHIKDN